MEKNKVTTQDEAYIGNLKIYNVGLKEDPVPGEKRGKGTQCDNSSYFISALSIFIASNL